MTGVTGQRLKILIVDDHAVVREGVKAALQKEQRFDIVGTAGDGLKAVELVQSLNPDIVIMDNAMPNLDGFGAVKEIRKRSDETKIIIYSMLSDIELITALFKEGIAGYVLKSQPISEMITAVRSVAGGGTYYSSAIGRSLREYMSEATPGGQEDDILKALSVREREIFLLLADGLQIKKIADQLCISPKTVETHKYKIMDKLDAKSMAEITKIAVKRRLIEI